MAGGDEAGDGEGETRGEPAGEAETTAAGLPLGVALGPARPSIAQIPTANATTIRTATSAIGQAEERDGAGGGVWTGSNRCVPLMSRLCQRPECVGDRE